MIDFAIPAKCQGCEMHKQELDGDVTIDGEIHHFCRFWEKNIDEVDKCRGFDKNGKFLTEIPQKIVCRQIVVNEESK